MDRDQGPRKRQREFSFQPSSLTSHASGSSLGSFSQPSFSQQPSDYSGSNSSKQSRNGAANIPAAQYLGQFLAGCLHYLLGTIHGSLLMLQPLFSFLLVILLIIVFLGGLTKSITLFRSEFQSRILCSVPGARLLLTCPNPRNSFMLNIPDFSDLVNKQAASYEFVADSIMNQLKQTQQQQQQQRHPQKSDHNIDDPYGLIIHTTKGNLPLPMLLKRAEIAVVDLKVLVKHSTLPKEPKDLLVEHLQSFHGRAKALSRKLQFLQARANACVDGLVIRNTYLTIELDRLEAQQRSWNEQKVNGGALIRLLSYFSDDQGLAMASGAQKIQQLYQGTMEDARTHVRDLILQTQDVLQNLDTMDQILSSIHDIVTMERREQNKAQDETLALLWSKLGGNKIQKEFHKENLQLLVDMENQRKSTVGQIQTALWKLTEFEAEIGTLRERIVDAAVGGAENNEGKEKMKIESPSDVEEKAREARLSSAAALRGHIQQIELVTGRLKERSFLADMMVKEQADKIPGVASEDSDDSSS
ncbi:hypothetical protein EMPS_08301 [Entomortierella parvispora]|uniref:Uncharacterized protein n=1 Tax=Entomortierella parvispora TaxID=205924 RepID=A0A9P3HG38_9FUNG|nr:hypothetical protein EMPS_08301 [Entomortierella parvispora]